MRCFSYVEFLRRIFRLRMTWLQGLLCLSGVPREHRKSGGICYQLKSHEWTVLYSYVHITIDIPLSFSRNFSPSFDPILHFRDYQAVATMTITDNQAAWQTAATTRPLKVGPGPTPDPAENEVVIKVAYAAVNSCDWNVRFNFLTFKYTFLSLRTLFQFQTNPYWEIDYPFLWGTDVAGTIVQLGSNITRFKLGERVIGYNLSLSLFQCTNR